MRRRVHAISAAVLGCLAVLSGCSNSQSLTGRVLPGRAGLVTVVAADDPRMAEPGLGGVRVRVVRGAGTPGSLSEGVSQADGSFTLRVPAAGLSGRVDVVASGDAVLTARGSIYIPSGGRRVLVIVEQTKPEPGR